MEKNQINSEKIYYAVLSGAREVIKQRAELNRINVFPVPDGDTGSNLAYTMHKIIANSRIEDTVKKTLGSIAKASLTGARGNSGIIFSQFINGVYMEIDDKESITTENFSTGVARAVEYAYKAIMEPVEGTMITVIRDWADSLFQLKEKALDFTDLILHSFDAAVLSLKQTPEKLKILKDASVVDSGAKGFVHFLEGFLQFLKTGSSVSQVKSEEFIDIANEDIHVTDKPDFRFRYCTEILISGDNLDTDQIKADISGLGNSFIIAGNPGMVRIHMHTNSPEEVLKRLRKKGRIEEQKSDDMLRQFEAVHSRKHKIALVTDSIADFPKAFADKHQIHMIPLNLIIDGSSYLDKVTITPGYFYNVMEEAGEYPTSAQPTVENMVSFLRYINDHYEKIIVISVSGKMSGTLGVFNKGREMLNIPDEKIAIIDSKQNSGAQGLVVMQAALDIEAGKDFNEIIDSVNETIKNTRIFVSVRDLKYMIRSGRIGRVTGMAANMMNFKPVVSIDETGHGIIIGKTFSIKGNTKKIYSLFKKISKERKIIRYAVVHANDESRAREFAAYFTGITGSKPEYVTDISSIVAMSAGTGSVAVAVQYA